MRKYGLLLFLLLSSTGLLLYCSGPTEPELDNPYDQESDSYIPTPDLNTAPVEPLATAAITGGVFETDFGLPVTQKGVCWSSSETPTIDSDCTNDGEGNTSFESIIEGLELETQYFVRAYAFHEGDTLFGRRRRFTTRDGVPSLTTTEPFNIGRTSARTGGTITDYGGAEITESGVCYMQGDGTPDLSDMCITGTVDSDVFEVLLEDLVSQETYTVRAYATNELATAWGESKDFTTLLWPRDTETEIVDVTNPATGRTWMDRNLGASRVAMSSTDSEAYGDLYQWGRAADGHEKRNSPTTTTLSNSDQPGHGDFILAPDSPYDWRSPQNDNLWQGEDGINNPCPDGYRLPTEAEWDAERESWDTNDASGAFNSPLKLPMAGFRSLSSGSLIVVGSNGYYWSASVSGSRARFLYFLSSNALMGSLSRADGSSVRCLEN